MNWCIHWDDIMFGVVDKKRIERSNKGIGTGGGSQLTLRVSDKLLLLHIKIINRCRRRYNYCQLTLKVSNW